MSNLRSDWHKRLQEEERYSITAFFITLTYDDKHEKWGHNDAQVVYTTDQAIKCDDFASMTPQLQKKDVQDFLKRLRIRVDTLYQQEGESVLNRTARPKIKYFICGEYGTDTFRPHYHGIFFNLPYNMETLHNEQRLLKLVRDTWQNGMIKIDKVNTERLQYVTKYMINQYEEVMQNPPFRIMSKHLGENYLEKKERWHKKQLKNYYPNGEKKEKLPRYYRDRLFTKWEKDVIQKRTESEMDSAENALVERYGIRALEASRIRERELKIEKLNKSKKGKL